MNLRTTKILQYAGLFTWVCVSLAYLMLPIFAEPEGESMSSQQNLLGWAALAFFGLGYWQLSDRLQRTGVGQWRMLLLGLLVVAALVVSQTTHTNLGGLLLLVVAGAVAWVLPLKSALAWLIAQNIGLTLLVLAFDEISLGQAIVYGGLNLGLSSFVFATSIMARRHAEARAEMRKVNSELRATQALLAESTRIAERVRISRELHDLVGHHLTALSLNLEVASHLVKGKAQEHVAQAQSVAKLLLSDVREVVGSMREDDKIELASALASLADGVPEPQIHLDIPSHLSIDDPKRAQVILRCAQEVITNTVKHAEAANLWLTIRENEDGLAITARDDGRGTDELQEGNGLLGMGERLRQLGGQLSVKSALGEGFRLTAWLPREIVI